MPYFYADSFFLYWQNTSNLDRLPESTEMSNVSKQSTSSTSNNNTLVVKAADNSFRTSGSTTKSYEEKINSL